MYCCLLLVLMQGAGMGGEGDGAAPRSRLDAETERLLTQLLLQVRMNAPQ